MPPRPSTSFGRGFVCVGLFQPKNSINIGSVLRAAGCYDVNMVAISGKRYTRSNPDTLKAWRHIPMLQVDNLQDIVPYSCIPVAVDLVKGARPLTSYVHPERAFYIFGPEDGTLGSEVISWCRDTIYIPTRFCINLAACVNVVLYDRMTKSGKSYAPLT